MVYFHDREYIARHMNIYEYVKFDEKGSSQCAWTTDCIASVED